MNQHLADKLGGKTIKRGQVYRVYQQWLEQNDPLNVAFGVSPISDEDAEAKAELSDKKPKPPEEGKP